MDERQVNSDYYHKWVVWDIVRITTFVAVAVVFLAMVSHPPMWIFVFAIFVFSLDIRLLVQDVRGYKAALREEDAKDNNAIL